MEEAGTSRCRDGVRSRIFTRVAQRRYYAKQAEAGGEGAEQAAAWAKSAHRSYSSFSILINISADWYKKDIDYWGFDFDTGAQKNTWTI